MRIDNREIKEIFILPIDTQIPTEKRGAILPTSDLGAATRLDQSDMHSSDSAMPSSLTCS